MKSLFKLATAILTLTTASFAGVTISSPSNGSTVGSPTRIVSNSTSGTAIVATKIYVDNNLAYSTSAANVDTSLALAAGSRYIVVQSWDTTGVVVKSAVTVNVSTAAPTTTAGVVISSPANGSTVTTPVRVLATATSPAGISASHIYVDGKLVFQVAGGNVDYTLSLAAGSRYIVVQSWDNNGVIYKASSTVNVATATTTAPSTSNKVFENIEMMTGWEHCDSCAGIGGNGPKTPYSMTQGRVDPSLDGASTEFWLGGTTPYSNALWWKQLGGNSTAKNFVYELDFYMKNPGASQALEFDVNQSVNNRRYIFGTECNYKEFKTWRIWDTANVRWMNTGIPCPTPEAYKWNHLVFEFQRDGDWVKFVSVTLNGNKQYFNKAYFSMPVSNTFEVNVAFQMDGNYKQENHSTWLDRVKLTYW